MSRVRVSCTRSRAANAFNASPKIEHPWCILLQAARLLQLLTYIAPLWSRLSPSELKFPDGNCLENMLASREAASRAALGMRVRPKKVSSYASEHRGPPAAALHPGTRVEPSSGARPQALQQCAVGRPRTAKPPCPSDAAPRQARDRRTAHRRRLQPRPRPRHPIAIYFRSFSQLDIGRWYLFF